MFFPRIYLAAFCLSVFHKPSQGATLDQLQLDFKSPDLQYGPHLFWHWVNGNIRQDALDKDLDTMVAAGYGGALLCDVNAGIPHGGVDYGSDEWLTLLVHAVNGMSKRGLLGAMHNAPGYSGIGSKQLPPNMTMKELVWTETRVGVGNSSVTTLEQPFTKLGIYKDLFAFAYPKQLGEGTVFRDAVSNLSVNGVTQNVNITKTIDRENPIRLTSSSQSLDIAMTELFTAQAIAIYRIPETPKNTFDGARDYPPSWMLKISNDSITWQTILVSGNFPALREMDAPAVLTFNSVIARYYRLQPSGPSWMTGIDISSSPRLPNWAVKSHGAPGTISSNPATIANISSIDPDMIVDVSSHINSKGELNWQPSNGTYTVVRIGYTLTGQEMPATPEDTTPSLSVDLYSKAAIDAHFDTHLNRIIKALKPYIPKTFYGLEVDSYELGQQNWGGDLETDFHRLRGYSLRPWILAATGRVLGSAEATEKFLYDFRLTHANLMATNCYGYFQTRLAEQGLQLLIEPYGDGPFDSMELSSVADLSYGEFWSHYTYGSDGYSVLGQSSDDNKAINLLPSEAFTGQPDDSAWTEHPHNLKAEGDRMMTFGPNRFFLHDFVHQPVDAAFPGMTFGPFGAHFDRMNTWTKQASGWSEYIGRVALFMQNSARAIDVACFVGEEPSASAVIPYNSPYLVPLSYQSDIFSRSNLLNMTVRDGKASYPTGISFGLLIFPDMPSASASTVSKMLELAKGGVNILLLGQTPPSRSISLNDSNSEVIGLARQLWGMAGKGNVFVGNTTSQVLSHTGLEPDFTFTSSSNDAAIYYTHKRMDGDDVYFISNNLRKPSSAVLSMSGTGTPEIWDPMTGSVMQATVSSSSGNRIALSYTFGPSEAILVRLRNTTTSTQAFQAISKDNSSLYSTAPFQAFTATPWANISSSFTMSFWAKPEIFQVGTTGYVFYPTTASTYGTNHALSSMTMGINGIQLSESASSSATPSVALSLTTAVNNFTISGWSHFAVVYSSNQPTLYINGVLIATGPKSFYTVHPGTDTPDATTKMNNRFVGDIAGMQVTDRSLSNTEIQALYTEGLPAPDLPPPISFASDGFLIRENGKYAFSSAKKNYSMVVNSVSTTNVNGSWTVTLPAALLPPSRTQLQIKMPDLISLKDHPDFDVAHFSGTATYQTNFTFSPVRKPSDNKQQTRYLLNLGRVENIANVTVNGKFIGLSWLPPYELDVTSAIRTNSLNTLSIEVTNNWPNRLIGDETLPPEASYNSTTQDFSVDAWPDWFLQDQTERKPGERVTFAAWKHYNATDPLFDSGLLGPVTVTSGVEVKISN